MVSAFHLSKLYTGTYYWLERKAISLWGWISTVLSAFSPNTEIPGCLGAPEAGEGLKSRVDSIQGEEGVTDLIPLLWMELYWCCLVKQHKCKRGVNCFHISFRQQMRREMHFTGTSTKGACLAWCNVGHLFSSLRNAGLFLNMASGGAEEEGWGCTCRGRKKGAPVILYLWYLPSFLC